MNIANSAKFLSALMIVVLFISITQSQTLSDLEKQLQVDISDSRLDKFNHITAAFILSGVKHPDSLNYYLTWYNNLVQTLENYHFDSIDRVNSAAKVFSYLHSTWLENYEEKATTLIDVVKNKKFNCVAGTILYNLVCEDLGWSTEAFETPTHTYTLFPNFTEKVMVENTTPMGFDIMKNLRTYSEYLVQFYPKNQALQIGLDRIYEYENSRGRYINNTELLGLLAYNRAYFAMDKQEFESAYEYVLLAQSFNQDSRSNINFELNLYHVWGKKLFDQYKYVKAFQVYADAYYRYWNNKDFAHNCKASFFNALRRNWHTKNWKNTKKLVNEILELELLENGDKPELKTILKKWSSYHKFKNNPKEIEWIKEFSDTL